jgi:hypothetical protein
MDSLIMPLITLGILLLGVAACLEILMILLRKLEETIHPPIVEPPGKWFREIQVAIYQAQTIEDLKQVAIDLALSEKIDTDNRRRLELQLNEKYSVVYQNERLKVQEKAYYNDDTLR